MLKNPAEWLNYTLYAIRLLPRVLSNGFKDGCYDNKLGMHKCVEKETATLNI